MNELSTILTTILSTVVPLLGGGAWAYRKQNKKLKDAEVKLAEANIDKVKAESKSDEWHIIKEQNESISDLNLHLIERNEHLVKMLAEKEDRHQDDIKDWQKRCDELTLRTREVQREREQLSKDKIGLIEEIGELKLELQRKRCNLLTCPYREPPTAYTPPKDTRTIHEYFAEREINIPIDD